MNRNHVEQKLTMHTNTLKKELYEAEPFCFSLLTLLLVFKTISILHRSFIYQTISIALIAAAFPELGDVTVSFKQCVSFTQWDDIARFLRLRAQLSEKFRSKSHRNGQDSSRKFLHFLFQLVASRKETWRKFLIAAQQFSSISSMFIFHCPTRFQRSGDREDVLQHNFYGTKIWGWFAISNVRWPTHAMQRWSAYRTNRESNVKFYLICVSSWPTRQKKYAMYIFAWCVKFGDKKDELAKRRTMALYWFLKAQ